MIKRALFLILTGMLCAGVALAGKPNTQGGFTLNGTQPSVNLNNTNFNIEGGGVGQVSISLNATALPDGSMGYYADIWWNYGGSNYYWIDGYLPASVVTLPKGPQGPVQVNITYASFIPVTNVSPVGNNYSDFSSFTGTFTVYTGPNSQQSTTNGLYTDSFKLGDGTTLLSETFKGTTTTNSANFDGTLDTDEGSFTVTSNGSTGVDNQISVSVGTVTCGPDGCGM